MSGNRRRVRADTPQDLVPRVPPDNTGLLDTKATIAGAVATGVLLEPAQGLLWTFAIAR